MAWVKRPGGLHSPAGRLQNKVAGEDFVSDGQLGGVLRQGHFKVSSKRGIDFMGFHFDILKAEPVLRAPSVK